MKILDENRLKYVKKIGKSKICELCKPDVIKKQSCRNLSARHWHVFVNKYPYMDGNVMIVPKRHLRDIEDLSQEEWDEFRHILAKTKKILAKIFKTEDFNIGLNIGKNSGNSLEHMHWQVIPRYFAPLNSANIFADLHIIKMLPAKLKILIEKQRV